MTKVVSSYKGLTFMVSDRSSFERTILDDIIDWFSGKTLKLICPNVFKFV